MDDRSCEFCYYQELAESEYPCSRCVCNAPTENKFRPKDTNEYERGKAAKANLIKEFAEHLTEEDVIKGEAYAKGYAKGFKEGLEAQTETKAEMKDAASFWATITLGYERGKADAWATAQKVFDSELTLYEAEDVAKQMTEPCSEPSDEFEIEEARSFAEVYKTEPKGEE